MYICCSKREIGVNAIYDMLVITTLGLHDGKQNIDCIFDVESFHFLASH